MFESRKDAFIFFLLISGSVLSLGLLFFSEEIRISTVVDVISATVTFGIFAAMAKIYRNKLGLSARATETGMWLTLAIMCITFPWAVIEIEHTRFGFTRPYLLGIMLAESKKAVLFLFALWLGFNGIPRFIDWIGQKKKKRK